MNLFERLILRRLMNVAGEGGEGGAPATGNEEQQQGQQEQQTPASLLNSGEPAGQQQGQQPQQQGQQQAPAAFIEKLPDDGDEKGWQDLYAKLGRPEKIEDYGIKPPEGSDGTFLNTALGWMHESGLNKKQAENVINKFNEYAAEQQKKCPRKILLIKMLLTGKRLSNPRGSEVEANTAILQHAVQRFFPDAVIEKFSTAGLLNDPDLVNAVLGDR